MVKIITFDKDKKIINIEEKPKDFRPLNGYEKGIDGHFYKTLCDPRCISDQEKFEQEARAKNKVFTNHNCKKHSINQFEKKNTGITPVTKNSSFSLYDDELLATDHCLNLKEFKSKFLNYGEIDLEGSHILYKAKCLESFEQIGDRFIFEKDEEYCRIEISTYLSAVKIWKKDGWRQRSPDILLYYKINLCPS